MVSDLPADIGVGIGKGDRLVARSVQETGDLPAFACQTLRCGVVYLIEDRRAVDRERIGHAAQHLKLGAFNVDFDKRWRPQTTICNRIIKCSDCDLDLTRCVLRRAL